MEEIKICTKCKVLKYITEYYGKKKLLDYCKPCHKDSVRKSQKKYAQRIKNYLKTTQKFPNLIYSRKRANAKQQNLSFTISKEDFIEWYGNQTLICHYCGLDPEDFVKTGDKFITNKLNLSVDRVDNSLGYDLSNIVLCCNRCNSIKGNFFSYEEMKAIGFRYVRKHWNSKGIRTHKEGFKSASGL